MTGHRGQPPQDFGSAAATYMILFVAIIMIMLPTLVGLCLGRAPIVNVLP